jgi:hypothetical protein
LMDHASISNTVDITDAFKVAGGSTADVSSCLDFWVLFFGKGHGENRLHKFSTFLFLFWALMSHKSKGCLFLHTR